METNTKYFGPVTYEKEDIVFFKEGLYGFEEYQQYLLIHFDPVNPNLLCLQSLDEESLAFVLVSPFSTMPEYAPVPSADDMKALDLSNDSEVTYYALCVVREPLKDSTVNLRCPLLINPLTRHAKQIMLENYPLKHPLGCETLR